jgi:hypothetical protein
MPQNMNALRKIGPCAARSALQRMRGLLILTLACPIFLPSSLRAAPPDIALMCDLAAKGAARDHGVPLDVLRALIWAETGRVRNQLSPVTTMAALPGKHRKRASTGLLPLASLRPPELLIAQGTVSRGSLVPIGGSGGATPLTMLQ